MTHSNETFQNYSIHIYEYTVCMLISVNNLTIQCEIKCPSQNSRKKKIFHLIFGKNVESKEAYKKWRTTA